MNIILQEDFPSLGYVGDTVKVKNGYARNFLIPNGIALEASSRNAKLLKHRLAGVEAKKAKLKLAAEEVAKGLEALNLKFKLRIGGHGKSFGAVSPKNVHDQLVEKGFDVSRKQLKLHEAIKSGGEFTVDVQLHAEVVARLKITVTAEVESKKKSSEAVSGKRKKSERVAAEKASDESETQPEDELKGVSDELDGEGTKVSAEEVEISDEQPASEETDKVKEESE